MGLGTQALCGFPVYWPCKFSPTSSVSFLSSAANSGWQFFFISLKNPWMGPLTLGCGPRLEAPLPALSHCLIPAAPLCSLPQPPPAAAQQDPALSLLLLQAESISTPSPARGASHTYWLFLKPQQRLNEDLSFIFLITDTTVTFPFNTCLPIPTILLCPEHHDWLSKKSDILEEDTEFLSVGVY